MITRLRYIFIVLFAIVLCNCESEVKKVYYDNGSLKAEIILNKGERDGYCKYYYEKGQISYEGLFQNNLRVGKHLDYFEDIEKVESEIFYEIEAGKEKPIKRVKYNRFGQVIYESNLANFKTRIDLISAPRFPGDTLKFRVKILDPRYPYTDAFIGNFDRYLNQLDSVPVLFFGGTSNHEVHIAIPIEKDGLNKITGFIRDFDIKPINDSIGVTIAYDTYFEYPYTLKR
jgi:hypothetical protein